jgi:hypothetical protein
MVLGLLPGTLVPWNWVNCGLRASEIDAGDKMMSEESTSFVYSEPPIPSPK